MKMLLNPAEWGRVMIFAPHPDDETLATGGLLQQVVAVGGAVRVVFATDGDNNPWPQRVIERRWQIEATDRARWGARRRAEALAALTCLGISASSVRFLRYPDQGLSDLLLTGDPEPLVTLAKEIADWRPTLLVTPSALDLHPDHSALAVLLRFARARLSLDLSRFTEISYLIHGRQQGLIHHAGLSLRLRPEEQMRKRQAILCHTSQLVLSWRRFLAFAEDSERFLSSAEALGSDKYHPVHSAIVEGSTLRLGVRRRRRLLASGTTTLYIVADNLIGNGARFSMMLPGKPAEVDVHDVSSGGVSAQAHFRSDQHQGELRLPLSALPPVQSIFVKLECGFGFFDEAGWREIPLTRPRLCLDTNLAVHFNEACSAPVVCCVVPCYNVAPFCREVICEAARYADHVIAINDGSTDDTGEVLRTIAAESAGRVRLLSFASNRGKGVALLEGFRYALAELVFDVLITLDGDRQHRPADIPRLVRAWAVERAALVIGERRQFAAMPFRSRLGNLITSTLLRKMYPASPYDTQSGLRALSRSFVTEVLRVVEGGRYETELCILLLALRRRRRISTVPVPTVYINRNRTSHFRPIIDSWRIYRTLLSRRLLAVPTQQYKV
ncbi:MAG TPA: PIG-L family deacetylase [Candidatus Binatia bacterium]|nr:PIG-L family deacetylase [Candidatus Binatia bacterium]